MKRKDMLRQLLTPTPAEDVLSPQAVVPETSGRRAASGAVRAMGLDLERLASDAQRARELERQATSGQAVLEIDPAQVDPSFAEDRVARTSDGDYRRLVDSIAASGQQVPILLRPHPEAAGRYQVAYGHRRLAAAAELGISVRAVVRPLSDIELVIAQGKENAERRNLSFIERALFAADLEARGFDRATLYAALAAHPAEMTRYLSVARSVPRWLVQAIGPAPRAGRPRWMELAELLAADGAEVVAAKLTKRADFRDALSDRRFELMIGALRKPKDEGGRDAPVIRNAAGEPVVRLERAAGGPRLVIMDQVAPGLSDFLLERLPSVIAEFEGRGPGCPAQS
ncbi:plasmid partitioning protein RepB [Roseicella aquatilis]|uniref:Plasmid partitioning protein RepB n=1 Tax=Roseicella aquatilis TaxID=2527868 RepID=A0A4R4DKR8_9PROT|nr:plasmid partitioning protein RepB [Roseicella aquatilis]TCZ61072.1 plasmid partitioning protein RepB [Roseicella aquatilis]